MILILIALITSAVVSYLLFWYAKNNYKPIGEYAAVAGFIIALATGIGGLVYAFNCWNWIAAGTKAQIINREYGTSYTQKEVFFASDVIDTIREIDRKRVEVNGNVMRDATDKTSKDQ